MTEEERARRIAEVVAEEKKASPIWWYLSFVDTNRPEGDRWLGVCWVKAGGPATAIQSAHTHGINPGGQVASLALPFRHDPPKGSAYKLHRDRDEVDRLCRSWKGNDE